MCIRDSGNENIYALLFSWTDNAVLSKEMERAYKNKALKEGAAGDADTFNENSENCYLDPRCEVLWFRPTPVSYTHLDVYKRQGMSR